MVTISETRRWQLDGLTSTAEGLRSGAGTLDEQALTIINRLAGIGTDWQGETRNQRELEAKDRTESMQEKAHRWRGGANVLDRAADQLGKLRTAILNRVDDPGNKQKYVIADDGNVELSDTYVQTLNTKEAQDLAEVRRANLETELRSLLATADLAGQQYDWKVTNALTGTPDELRPFSPTVPPPTARPTAPKESADKDGSGPGQYNIDKPGFLDKAGLQGTRAWAEALVGSTRAAGQQYSPDLLQHFLDGSGKPATMPVDNMLKDMPWFKQSADALTKDTMNTAIRAMPPGYEGPVAFQSDYTSLKSDGTPARPGATKNPDWFAALGTFSYQSSGVALQSGNGTYSVDARTSIFDYYNFETTDQKPWPQASDLNKLHRAGWAQNFDTIGSSSVQTSTWP
ncbi:hypothetical protein [Mycobacteroides chelonae]|uniref:hypothetical protein n=1 Tax=Mycobacteroides chelonae TaxID=1774 RepID=UPI0004AB0772|nr:hypothetical protein [Mycobacteroides chelonae]MBF9315608.1 hypothetical protein [Mycobacteroides chelonae]OHT75394.1 hypothetical protein BKG67_06720 [Mycobacteroides chelonae]OHT75525.1 hypothetical protein BKG66_00345 [Mycobacteroides chelonae]OHT91987.1 hypothetical protein BKG70_05050 [Mycobacteroides chelonae]